LDIRVLVDRSIIEVFIGGGARPNKLVKSVSWQSNLTQKCTFGVAYTGRVAAVMAYQPPNDVGDPQAMDLASYTNVHLFAEQSQAVSNVTIHQMGCGWNQTGKLLA
jgi:hypothetical protein